MTDKLYKKILSMYSGEYTTRKYVYRLAYDGGVKRQLGNKFSGNCSYDYFYKDNGKWKMEHCEADFPIVNR